MRGRANSCGKEFLDVTVSWAPEATSQCACYDITMAGLWMRDLASDAWVGVNSAHAV